MADLLVDLMFDKMQIYALNGGLNQAYLLHLKKLWEKNPQNFRSKIWGTLSKTPAVFEKSEASKSQDKRASGALVWVHLCKKIKFEFKKSLKYRK